MKFSANILLLSEMININLHNYYKTTHFSIKKKEVMLLYITNSSQNL